MKFRSFFIIVALLMALGMNGQVTFSGNNKEVFDEVPQKSTGLNHIYVLYNTAGVSMSYRASTDETVNWYSFGQQGAAYQEPISGITRSGRTTTLPQVTGNQGYVIEEGTNRTYVWLVNYADCYLRINNIYPGDPDCNTATINVEGTGPDIAYYTINGVHKSMSRDLKISYRNLVWDEDETRWTEVDTTETEELFKNKYAIVAPYCNTQFTISGDRFLKFWGEDVELTSATYQTKAIAVHTTAVQASKEGHDNEKGKAEEGQLGGSAPVTITFTAYCTDAVTHKEWQMASDVNFDNIQLRLNVEETEQTFEEAGTTYWRFVASSDDGDCEAYSDTYTVNIGESELECPNFFSPGATEDSHDKWKVSYKSIVEFHCWIFNSWGVQMTEFTDPSGCWDGTYRGKVVKPGVYYYVIKAKGGDGKVYNLSGDINILGYHKREGVVSSSGGE